MRTFAETSLLRHGLVRWGHLGRRIYIAVELKPLQGLQIRLERTTAWPKVVGLSIRVALDVALVDRDVAKFCVGGLLSDDRGLERRTQRFLVIRNGAVLRWPEFLEEPFRPLTHVWIRTDAPRESGEAVRENCVVEDDDAAGRAQFLDGLHECGERLGVQGYR